jgi:hypothetical protein
MKRHVIALALVMQAPASASAETALYGLGGHTCAQFAQDYRAQPDIEENAYFIWAMGFMSGVNTLNIETYGRAADLTSISVEDQRAVIREYCEAHPLKHYFEAVTQVYSMLHKPTAHP